uniref:NADH dehydrogenase subunit 3 n=1 Tax=Polypodium hydriforme TaxID=43186 RepID=UPI00211544A0
MSLIYFILSIFVISCLFISFPLFRGEGREVYGQKRPYECGFEPKEWANIRYCVPFWKIVSLFVLFEAEFIITFSCFEGGVKGGYLCFIFFYILLGWWVERVFGVLNNW